MPRYAALGPDEAEFKSAGELVTIADREAEALISGRLRDLLPGSVVIGEEACAANPLLLDRMGSELAWLVDPIDGTRNFVEGRPPFALMVALLADGEPVGACILDPLDDRICIAELGGGAWIDGLPVRTSSEPAKVSELTGIVSEAFLPPEQRSLPDMLRANVAEVVPTLRCAGHEYPQVALGERDFALYWRTLAWDHAPGTLFLREAGGSVTHLDGTPYRPQEPRAGLLLARTPEVASELLEMLAKSRTCRAHW